MQLLFRIQIFGLFNFQFDTSTHVCDDVSTSTATLRQRMQSSLSSNAQHTLLSSPEQTTQPTPKHFSRNATINADADPCGYVTNLR